EVWPSSLLTFAIGDQRELGDDERGAADVEHAPVEAAGVVGEDSEARDLSRKPIDVTVASGNAEQDAKAGPDLPHDRPVDTDAGLGHALADRSHRGARGDAQSSSLIRARYCAEFGRSELASL